MLATSCFSELSGTLPEPSPKPFCVRVFHVSLSVVSVRGAFVIQQPPRFGKFEFAVMASLRASQLTRGCLPRVDGDHTVAVMAQLEVAEGKVPLVPAVPIAVLEDAPSSLPEPGES